MYVDRVDEFTGVVLGALIAAVAGLIGLRLSRRTEQEQWIRNQKILVYSDVARSLDAFILDGSFADAGRRNHDPKDLSEMTSSLHDGLSRLTLIAPFSVITPASDAQAAAMKYSGLNRAKVTRGELDEAHRAATLAKSTFIAHARIDLGAHDHEFAELRQERWFRFASRNLASSSRKAVREIG